LFTDTTAISRSVASGSQWRCGAEGSVLSQGICLALLVVGGFGFTDFWTRIEHRRFQNRC
jgi:hypothetical protein